MSEQVNVGQQEAVHEQGASAIEQGASAIGQEASVAEQEVLDQQHEVANQEPVDSTQDAQSTGSETGGAAGDQEIAKLKALEDTPLDATDSTAANLSNGITNSSNGMANPSNGLNMDSLMDVPVTLSVEIGRKRMPINQLVNLAPGAIVDLNRDLDAPIDLLVNGTLIARGEVVVMGKKFGLRLVDICSPNERIRGLAH